MRSKARWLIFDPLSRCWWGPNKIGRFPDIAFAGLYTREEAREIRRVAKSDPYRLERPICIEEYRVEIERLYTALGRKD